MKITADYHTHTIYSHGKGTIEDNVKAAIIKGLKTIAISDHGPLYYPYGIEKCKYKEMREIVDRLKDKYSDVIEILLGIEANIIDKEGNLDIDDEILRYNDILLAGFHFHIVYRELLQELSLKDKGYRQFKSMIGEKVLCEIIEVNTQAVINCLKKYKVDILTHLGDQQPIDIKIIAKIAEKTGTAIEINNFHRFPTLSQIIEASQCNDLKFVLSSDAHRPRDVGNHKRAIKVLRQSGIDFSRVLNIKCK